MTTRVSCCGDAPIVQLELAQTNVIPGTVNQLRDVLAAHPWPSEVRLWGPEKTTVYRLGFRVDARAEFWADLKAEVATIRAYR